MKHNNNNSTLYCLGLLNANTDNKKKQSFPPFRGVPILLFPLEVDMFEICFGILSVRCTCCFCFLVCYTNYVSPLAGKEISRTLWRQKAVYRI
jgi:hypothetical protein